MSLATRADEPEVLLRERSGTPILIVDDQSEAQSLLTWSLRRAGVQNPIHCLSDGHEAIRYLGGEPPYCDRINYPLPGVLFLDLKLPVLDGWEVLDWIQGCGMKRDCLIFICAQFTGVAAMQRVYNLGAESFLKKPIQEPDLLNLIHHFPRPWTFGRSVPVESFPLPAIASKKIAAAEIFSLKRQRTFDKETRSGVS